MRFFQNKVCRFGFVLLGSTIWLHAYAIEDSSAKESLTPKVLLVYESSHNPPRALGTGTAINWKKPGLTLELIELVSEQTGIEFQFKRMPWKRALYLLEKTISMVFSTLVVKNLARILASIQN
jgi:hypothetical protein